MANNGVLFIYMLITKNMQSKLVYRFYCISYNVASFSKAGLSPNFDQLKKCFLFIAFVRKPKKVIGPN
jgi:hypothetical protein